MEHTGAAARSVKLRFPREFHMDMGRDVLFCAMFFYDR